MRQETKLSLEEAVVLLVSDQAWSCRLSTRGMTCEDDGCPHTTGRRVELQQRSDGQERSLLSDMTGTLDVCGRCCQCLDPVNLQPHQE